VLAHGCPVDLEVVAVGDAVQGVLAGCQVVLGRVDDGWRCYVRASYARHLAAWLTDAATPYV
jgi:sarcosine oxidase, subunit gamma